MHEMTNTVDIKGYVHSHKLEAKVSGPNSKNPGTAFIQGTLNVATDEDGMNVVPVSFTYVTEFYSKSGKPNTNYALLLQIINEGRTFETCGNAAMKVRIDGEIENNDFVTRDGEMASPKRVRGNWIHTESGNIAEVGCAKFDCDMFINEYVEREVDDGENYGSVRGYTFGYQNKLVEIDLSVRGKGGMGYFDSKGISKNDPMLTHVWGDIESTTIEKHEEIENAFGAPTVKTTTRSLRSWNITGASPEPAVHAGDFEAQYQDWNSNDAMTAEEFKKLEVARAEYLASVRQRHEEYQASKGGGNAFAASTPSTSFSPTASSDYKF